MRYMKEKKKKINVGGGGGRHASRKKGMKERGRDEKAVH